MSNARAEALSLLLRYEEESPYLNLLLPRTSPRGEEERRTRAFLTALLYGTVERKLTLDYAIAAYLQKPAESLASHTRACLRLGLYQIFFMKGVPAYAAIAETLHLAQHAGEKALLSGVLHRAAREKTCPLPPREKNLERYLSIAYSLPRETVRLFLSQYGEKETEEILRAFLAPAPLTLRVNTLRTTRERLLSALEEAGVEAVPTRNAPAGIRLAKSLPPTGLPGFSTGEFFVQDEASQVAVAALSVGTGDCVLDLCAAPGGKSFGAAMDGGGVAAVTACDLHASKLSLITGGAERLGLSSLSVTAADATAFCPEYLERYTRVLADVPCSGLGVLGKKPDMRYADPARFRSLLPIQERILDNAAAYVAPGGLLVYSTCTLRSEENERQVAAFLQQHPEFSLAPFAVGEIVAERGSVTLLPSLHGTDGFFIARMRKEL